VSPLLRLSPPLLPPLPPPQVARLKAVQAEMQRQLDDGEGERVRLLRKLRDQAASTAAAIAAAASEDGGAFEGALLSGLAPDQIVQVRLVHSLPLVVAILNSSSCSAAAMLQCMHGGARMATLHCCLG
jgi:hypothetical protein